MSAPCRIRHNLLAAAIVVATLVPPAHASPLPAGTYRILPDQSQVGFIAVKWSMFTIAGQFQKHRGRIVYDPADPRRSEVTWEVEAASVSTGNADRDRALRSPSFLDVDEHPWLRFASTSVRIAPDRSLEVEGALSIRGITRPVRSTVRFLGGREVPGEGFLAGFATEFTIDRRDFGVLGGALSQQMIGNEVKIQLSAGALREEH